MNSNGALVISLDFELLWGVFDKVDWREKKEYFQNTRKLIPDILNIFEKYEISCTWATVGMLFNHDWDEWNSNIPKSLPQYEKSVLSAYTFGRSIQNRETEAFCFAPDLIKQIKKTPRQEIGTHTYSHYYCMEAGQTSVSFEADLLKSEELAQNYGISLKSLVFPRNQYNRSYLHICKKNGIQTVRTNPNVWYWQNNQQEGLSQKIFRTGDAYIGFNDKSYRDIPEIYLGIIGQKSSRFLRPNTGRDVLDQIRIKRIQREMKEAAQNNKVYHLWWHPHNFSISPDKCLEELQFILKYFQILEIKFGMKSYNMLDLTNNSKWQ